MNNKLVSLFIERRSRLKASNERPMSNLSLRVGAEYLALSSKGQPLHLLLFGTIVFDGRLEEDSFVFEWAALINGTCTIDSQRYLPSISQAVARSHPDKQLMVVLLHVFKTGFAHSQVLLVESLARCSCLASGELVDVVCA